MNKMNNLQIKEQNNQIPSLIKMKMKRKKNAMLKRRTK